MKRHEKIGAEIWQDNSLWHLRARENQMAGAKSEIYPLRGTRAWASSCNANQSKGRTTPQTDSRIGGLPPQTDSRVGGLPLRQTAKWEDHPSGSRVGGLSLKQTAGLRAGGGLKRKLLDPERKHATQPWS